MTKTTRHAALIAALLAAAGIAQAQVPQGTTAVPRGESANRYPTGMPEAQPGAESRADVKAQTRRSALQDPPGNETRNTVDPSSTGSVPMSSTQSQDVKDMNRAEKKSDARMESKRGPSPSFNYGQENATKADRDR
jgi:hypothetical protein